MINSLQSAATLANGVRMPWLGLGVFKITDSDECKNAVTAALACGYRSIDTALGYRNEEAVGEALRSAGAPSPSLRTRSSASGWSTWISISCTGPALTRTSTWKPTGP